MTLALDERDVFILYRNHRGETAWRHVRPLTMYFGASDWHSGRQWFLLASDLDKKAHRTFALKDVLAWRDKVPEGGEDARAALRTIDVLKSHEEV